jgi:hypothetical protein
VREQPPVGARHDPLEIALDLHRVVVAGEAEALRKAADVRVDHDPLWLAELGCDDVGGLAGDPGKADEVLEPAGDTAVVVLDQHRHGAPDRLRLLAEEPGRVDVAFQLLLRDGQVVLGAAVLLEQRRGDAVHVHVGRLGGEHHGDEQLDVRPEPERDPRVGVLGLQPLDDRHDALLLRPDALPGLADEAAGH